MTERETGVRIGSRAGKILQGSMLSGGSVFVSMAAMLAVGKIFTNALSQADVAVFTLLLLGADFLNIFGNFGLWVSFPKLVSAAEPPRQIRIIGSGLGFQWAVSAALSALIVLLWACRPALPESGAGSWQALWPHLWLLPPLFIVGAQRDTAMAALAGLHRYGPRAVGIVVSSVAYVALAYLFVWRAGGGLVTLTSVTVASYGLALLWLLVALPPKSRACFDWPEYRESVRFSLPLYANSLLTFLFQRFDTVLIAFLLRSPEAVAIYEMAKRLPTILSRILGALLVPFLPNISHLLAAGERVTAARFLNRAITLAAFCGYLAVLAVALAQEPLIILLFNAEYLPATAALTALLTAMTIIVQAGIMGQALVALDRPHAVTGFNILASLASVGMNFVLIPRYGIAGAGIAAILTALLTNGAHAWYLGHIGFPLSWREYLKPQGIFAVSLALSVFGGGWMARGAALLLFVSGSFLLRVITLDLLVQSLRAVRQGR